MTEQHDVPTRRSIMGMGILFLEALRGGIPANAAPAAAPGRRDDRNPLLPADFQARGDGIANDTAALRAFFDACIEGSRPGHIPAGTYLVNAGALAFDNGHRRRAWPRITTDGHAAVTLKFADRVDGPMLALTNGKAGSAVGQYWEGGEIGGFTVEDAIPVANGGSNRHALSLGGVYATTIGWIRANGIAGSAICIPSRNYGPSNPDPYGVTYCTFRGVEANACAGRALTNTNGVGLNMCTFEAVRATNCELGAIYGLGGGNVFRAISVGSCRGWALYDGDEGEIDRALVDTLELDDVQYGIRLNVAQSVEIRRCRFKVRYNANPLNRDGGYWPRVALRLAADAKGAVRDTMIDIVFRVKPGGPPAALGKLLDFNRSAAISGSRIDVRLLDDPGFPIGNQTLVSGYNANSDIELRRDGKRIVPSS